MWSRHVLVLFGAAAATLHACAYPSFEFEDDDKTGGGAAITTSSVGGGGATATTTSAGGGQPTTCSLSPDSCPEGLRCTIVDETRGVPDGTACVQEPLPVDIHPPWSRCTTHTECDKGTLCDARTNICRPICTSPAECPSGADCIAAPKKVGEGDIPGVQFCTANCHPIQGTPCDDGFGDVTCIYEGAVTRTDCARSAGTTYGQPCSSLFDCAKGTLCIDDSTLGKFCGLICSPYGQTANCSGFQNTCTTPQFSHNGQSFGVCTY